MNLGKEINKIEEQLLEFLDEQKNICITSSFQTHSLPLLHICSKMVPEIEVLFIDTGFHFAETYDFRDTIVKDWNLNLVNVKSSVSKHQQKNSDGHFLYSSDTNYCCHINKVEPLETELVNYDVWIAGLRRDQTKYRNTLQEFQNKNGILKYHPILDWNSKMIYSYKREFNLPNHPLDNKGYLSIGCMPCTRSSIDNTERGARWYGTQKTECGIHLK